MPASFPSSAKAFTTKSDGPGNTILAAHVNDLQAEVTAIEQCLLGTTALNAVLNTVTTGAGVTAGTTATAATGFGTASGQKIYLDGVAMSGDTYIQESTANTLALVSGGNAINIASGVMTKPVQPAFSAIASAQSNVTGDGTAYTVLFATESFDQANNFASPTFTAPVTGKYLFTVGIGVTGMTTSHTSAYVQLTVNGVGYITQLQRASNFVADDTWYGTVSALVAMTAAQTATVILGVSGGTKVADVLAGSWFSSHLVC